MSFKLHLAIVSLIIVAVFVAWQMRPKPQPIAVAPAPQVKQSPYSIEIVHASWGLNCRYTSRNGDGSNDSFAKFNREESSSKLREDNVLVAVSDLCNGKLKCDVRVHKDVLGTDPEPACSDKELNIEYRCFSFDRPWYARGTSGSVNINCDKPAK